MDIDRLKTVLAAGHPVTGSYDADNVAAAGELNAENVERDVETVEGQQIFEATTATDYNALTADQKTIYWGIVGLGTILVNGPNTKARLLAMFGSGTTTRANLAALQTETVSQAVAERLGLVRVGHVQQARL